MRRKQRQAAEYALLVKVQGLGASEEAATTAPDSAEKNSADKQESLPETKKEPAPLE